MYKLLKILAVCLAVSMIVGCHDSFLETRLDRAEQIINEHPDSAYSILNKVSLESISNSSQQARYALLLTMAQYKCDILPKNDSLINLALDYYKSGEYYQKSLIFKGAVMSELGHPIEAIEWYKKAETATPDDDYAQLGYINMRLGFIYRNAYMSNGYQIEKFKKSLACYNHTDDQKRQLVCLSEIGYSYYGIDKDSAYSYISSAIDYARQLNDSCSLFDNLQVLCRELRCDSLFEKSKELALYVIEEGSRYLSSYDIFHDIAYDYASLGMIDSAYFYFNRLPSEDLSKGIA